VEETCRKRCDSRRGVLDLLGSEGCDDGEDGPERRCSGSGA
jgi:hypothetical protein